MIENLLSEHDIALHVIAKGKRPALTKISTGLAQRAGITEKTILAGLLAREKVGSTAFGNGIAVPHALLDLSHPVASLTRLSAPIDFDAPDDSQVDLLFALLWPRRDIQQFLPTLASVSRMFRNKFLREALREARSPAEAFAIMCFEPMQFTDSAVAHISCAVSHSSIRSISRRCDSEP
ncbi:PTS system nitrogen regulatory IIA component [Afipia massiliensis]|uniref:PTS system nitrogen regulatory IIA component n=1 Tax=Afipia massiliensis TaxID=211460 RepID=A0A840N4X3_9BRAD|nr:PTS sugar transporter subunit IIA [Afipia massiliensis]MBB5055093.1 PTS system nitrogen regulatory IIA component [Afipia massiliensis]